MNGFRLEIFNGDGARNAVFTYNDLSLVDPAGHVIPITTVPSGTIGDRVRISIPKKRQYLTLNEVQVFSETYLKSQLTLERVLVSFIKCTDSSKIVFRASLAMIVV